ncbi:MAG TPA: DUF3566 domain-containing protein [Actinocrinis sp.]|uniref:DUF3566 domain-containing protein n=1 Tax=Actinocrinis sp. TaxID=1920516 RepID=UPI002DDC9BE7|nr:DUF3566 domain-containing protein [Actinocrinis sp.]HEV3172052.1 DUF3566 domain-containing protein [Actinocrinis sp.]
MTESPNPNEGRAAGSRTYGDAASTAVRQAATAPQFGGAPYASGQNPAVSPPAPQGQGQQGAPGGPQQVGAPTPTPTGARPGAAATESMGRALTGAGRSFARVGAAIGSAAQGEARQGGAAGPGSPTQARVRKARLRVARVDPWSVMKVSFVLSIAMGIVTIVGTAVVWNVLNALGVFSSLNKTVGDLTSSGSGTTTSSFSVSSFLSFSHVEGYMMIVALVDVVLVTALATLGSYLYNLASGFVGGFEVTLAEDQ